MFIRVTCLNGTSALVNMDDISLVTELESHDEFYQQTAKSARIHLKNNEKVETIHLFTEVENLLLEHS